AAEQPRALGVGGHDAVVVLLTPLEERPVAAHAGVVDEDVDAPVHRQRLTHAGGHLIGLGHVGDDGGGLASRRGDVGDQRVEVLLVAGRTYHDGALAAQRHGAGAPDPTARARDERNFVLQSHAASPGCAAPAAGSPYLARFGAAG